MSWRGAVALVLAIAIGVSWVVVVWAIVNDPTDVSDKGSVAFYGIFGTLVGGVLGWLAAARKDDDS